MNKIRKDVQNKMLKFCSKDRFEISLEQPSESHDASLNKEYRDRILNTKSCLDGSLLEDCLDRLKTTGVNMDDDFPNKQIEMTYEMLEKISAENPLSIFSECVTCVLNRSKNGVFRFLFELKFGQIVSKIKSSSLTWTSYVPGYFFQEIILLTILANRSKVSELTLNIIDDQVYEFAECAQDEEKNSSASSHLISFGFKDTRDDRRQWLNLLFYRYVKLLEWISDLGITAKLVLYRASDYIKLCSTDRSYQSDLLTGVDYIDQFLEYKYIFKSLSLSCVKETGTVASLRTDGMLSQNIVYEIYSVPFSSSRQEEWESINEKIAKNQEEMEKRTLREKIDEEEFFAPIRDAFEQIPSNPNSEKLTKIHRKKSPSLKPGQSMIYGKDGSYLITHLDGYQELKKEQKELEGSTIEWIDREIEKCNFIYRAEGLTWMIIREMFKEIGYNLVKSNYVKIPLGIIGMGILSYSIYGWF